MASTVKQSPITSSASATPSGFSHRQVQADFESLPGYENPLVSLIGYGKSKAIEEDRRFKVIIDRQPPQTVALSSQVDNSATTLTFSTTDGAMLQEGALLFIDEELIRVTTTGTGGTVGVERDFAGTTIATHITASVVHLLSPLYASNDEFVTSPFYRGEEKYFEVFRTFHGWEADSTSTAVHSYLTKGKTDMDFEIDVRKAHIATAKLERLLLYSKAQQMSGTQAGAPDGLYRLITTNAVSASGPLTPTDIVDAIEKIFAHKNVTKKRTVIGNHKAKRLWNAIMNEYFDRKGEPTATKLGLVVDSFFTDYGEMDFMSIEAVRDGELYILDLPDLSIDPLEIRDGTGTGWVEFTQGPENLNRRATRKTFEFQGLFVMGDERLHSKITGFSTTTTDYTNYV